MKIWRIIKSLALILALIFVSVPVVSASGSDDLLGTWERFGDQAEGTTVIVTRAGDYYQATLANVTGTLVYLGFAKGDLKWKELSPQSDGSYSGYDMFRYEGSTGYEYVKCRMSIGNDGILSVSDVSVEGVEVLIGTSQTWRRIASATQPAATAQPEATAAPTPIQSDEPSSWAVPEISKATEYGLTTDKVLRGYKGNITREEFSEIAVKLYEALSQMKAVPVSPNPFSDTTNPEVLKAFNLGIVKGTTPTLFSPDAPATREQIAAMLMRTLQAAKPGVEIDTSGVGAFADQKDISGYALAAIQYFNKQSVINGMGAGKINPKGNTTREQAVAMIKRVYESNQ